MHFIDRLEAKIKLWYQKRFLKRHGCATYREYERRYDRDIDICSGTVEEYYQRYRYLHRFDASTTDHLLKNKDKSLDEIIAWCDETCRKKWRYDTHRVIVPGKWPIMYKLVFAFQDERDYIDFVLRWS